MEDLRTAIFQARHASYRPPPQLELSAAHDKIEKMEEREREATITIGSLRTRVCELESEVATLTGILATFVPAHLPVKPDDDCDSFPSIDDIKRLVRRAYRLSESSLIGEQRTSSFVRPRHIAIYLCATLTPHSLPYIGRGFNRDHTTILHARNSISVKRANDPALHLELLGLEAKLKSPVDQAQ